MGETRRSIISRLRSSIKEVHGDTMFSNRYLWHVFNTSLGQILKEEADRNRIYNLSGVWNTICISMEPVSSLICNVDCLPYDTVVFRSKERLPSFIESSYGIVYRFVSTPDMSVQFTLVNPYIYKNKSSIKYNKTPYAFIQDGYLYTPSHRFPQLIISGIFLGESSHLDCSPVACTKILDLEVNAPDFIIRKCILLSLEELGVPKQLPQDAHPNTNSNQLEATP